MKAIEWLCALVIALVVILVYLASLPDWPVNDNGLFGPDGATKSHDALTYTQQFAINETYVKAMEEERSRNITLHIAANATQNVTVWKGNKVVAFIPGAS